MKMYNYRNIIEFGINPLTGEACSFGKRILCDLNEDGVTLLSEYFGIMKNSFPESWNIRVGRKEAIASVMIDRNAFTDIIIFALMLQGWRYLIVRDCDIIATNEDREMEAWRDSTIESISIIINHLSEAPRVASRNVHQMSARFI